MFRSVYIFFKSGGLFSHLRSSVHIDFNLLISTNLHNFSISVWFPHSDFPKQTEPFQFEDWRSTITLCLSLIWFYTRLSVLTKEGHKRMIQCPFLLWTNQTVGSGQTIWNNETLSIRFYFITRLLKARDFRYKIMNCIMYCCYY